MGNYRFSEFIDLNSVQKLAEANYSATGMPIAILDAVDGSILVAAGWQDICTSFHRVNPVTLDRCMESDNYVKSRLFDGEIVKYKCKNGLWDIAMPIMVDGIHMATLFLGQFFHEGEAPDREFFIRQAHETGFDTASYLAALDRVPVFNREKVDYILAYNKSLTGFIADLAEHTLRQLRVEEELLLAKYCIDKASMGVFQITEEGQIRSVNEYACQILGYSREELCSMMVFDLDPLFTREKFAENRKRLSASGSGTFETVHRRKDGTSFPVEVTVNYLEFMGKKFTLSFTRDITARKQMEEQIKSSLSEKEVLLKEIHHRVKNNLQIISALLELQSDYITDEKAKSIFRESQNRIKSMALVHQKLYQSEDLTLIDFAWYIENLTDYLFRTYVGEQGRIVLSIDVGDVSLGIDEAIPCGLLVNELVSNSLMHAFPDNRVGEISVKLHVDGDGGVILSVADNGIGLPPGLNFRDTESLGLQLVNMLAAQLRGSVDLQEDNGVSVTIRFKRSGNG